MKQITAQAVSGSGYDPSYIFKSLKTLSLFCFGNGTGRFVTDKDGNMLVVIKKDGKPPIIVTGGSQGIPDFIYSSPKRFQAARESAFAKATKRSSHGTK